MKVGIVGGGPAGLITGLRLLEHGFSVDLFEEHKRIGLPAHCAGIISLKTAEKLRKILGKRFDRVIKSRFYGLKIGLIGGKPIEHTSRSVRAIMVDRPYLDQCLSEVFSEKGGRLHLGIKAEIIKNGKLTLENGNKHEYDFLVDARGVKTYVKRNKSGKVLFSVQKEISSQDFEEEIVEIWIDKQSSPYFFYWVFKSSDEIVRTGVACLKGGAERLIDDFIKWRFGPNARVLSRYYGFIILSGPIKPFVDGKVLYVGDSAGQTKPLTGGGLAYGISGAEEASKSLILNEKLGASVNL
ncbi:hypothetical protein DRN86_01585, partial [Candidatus Geothermarchaeota archaeon]